MSVLCVVVVLFLPVGSGGADGLAPSLFLLPGVLSLSFGCSYRCGPRFVCFPCDFELGDSGRCLGTGIHVHVGLVWRLASKFGGLVVALLEVC